jgi:hypothetical protein
MALDGCSSPITILGNPSASPAAIEFFRKFLRVVCIILLVEAFAPREFSDWDRSSLTLPH